MERRTPKVLNVREGPYKDSYGQYTSKDLKKTETLLKSVCRKSQHSILNGLIHFLRIACIQGLQDLLGFSRPGSFQEGYINRRPWSYRRVPKDLEKLPRGFYKQKVLDMFSFNSGHPEDIKKVVLEEACKRVFKDKGLLWKTKKKNSQIFPRDNHWGYIVRILSNCPLKAH